MDDSAGLHELLRFGTIATVDLAAARCTVDVGDLVSPAIQWIEFRAGRTRTWSPPSDGEQVLLICPGGDLAAAVALRGLNSDVHPALGDSLRELIEFLDGALLAYDPEAHHLDIALPAGATLAIDASGGITIKGDIALTGKLTASDDVVADNISLKSHLHGNVQAGGAKTGAPE
jgi:phage baseplate assembly protein V